MMAVGYDWLVHRMLGGERFDYFGGTRGPWMEWLDLHGGYPNQMTVIITRLIILGYLVATVQAYRRYRHYLSREFANTKELALPGLGWLLSVLLLGALVTLGVELGNFLTGRVTFQDAWTSYLTMAGLLLVTGVQFYAIDPRLVRTLLFDELANEVQGEVSVAHDELARKEAVPASPIATAMAAPVMLASEDVEAAFWGKKLTSCLETQQPYLNPELKLGDLAAVVGTNSSVLSRVINTTHGQNFNDFINSYRCAAFLKKIAAGEQERHTLLSLALDSGFNSKSTFNRAFRKEYGYPPGEAAERLGAKS